MRKRTVCLVLAVVLTAAVIASCAGNTSNNTPSGTADAAAGSSNISTGSTADIYADDLQPQDFGGAPFRILARDESWLNVLYDTQQETGETINDAVYKRNRAIEARFNVAISQQVTADVNSAFSKDVKSGSNDYEIFLPIDRDALNFGAQGMIYKIADIPNIDLNKPFWNQSLNKCLTIGGQLFFAYGAFNLSVYDYTHVLLFNKQTITDLGLDSPYDLVNSGNWTYDTYAQMAKAAVKDLDGNGLMDQNDFWGYVSDPKQVLPCFWISAGVQSISKSSADIPQFTLQTDAKFAEVIAKIFTITYDNHSWYSSLVPAEPNDYYMNGHTLFLDCNCKSIGDLRSVQTDFGILPYPKYTADQPDYYSRVEAGDPAIVPVTAQNLNMIGTILEALNSGSAQTVIPAYYDVALKEKYARDDESSKMLDIIFGNRIYDLGDTYWCTILRDGIFLNMFTNNDRSPASNLATVQPVIDAAIDKVVTALSASNQ